MPFTRFRVATRASGIRRQVWVHVYENRAEMHQAHYRALEKPYNPDDDVAGGVVFTGGWRWPKPANGHPVVTMRLWTGQLTTRTIAHEATHAACALYAADVMPGWDSRQRALVLGDNEALAYLIGDISAEVIAGLYRLKFLA